MKFQFIIEMKKNEFTEAVHKTRLDVQMSILLSDEVLSPAVDLIPRPTLLLYEKEHIYIYLLSAI